MRVWRYVITHDTGFAPNFEPPSATLVTCKPRIRKDAKLHDLIIAFNGYRLIRAEPHSVRWAGIVADVMTLAAYWRDPRFQEKNRRSTAVTAQVVCQITFIAPQVPLRRKSAPSRRRSVSAIR